jgi:hypothetical protein
MYKRAYPQKEKNIDLEQLKSHFENLRDEPTDGEIPQAIGMKESIHVSKGTNAKRLV